MSFLVLSMTDMLSSRTIATLSSPYLKSNLPFHLLQHPLPLHLRTIPFLLSPLLPLKPSVNSLLIRYLALTSQLGPLLPLKRNKEKYTQKISIHSLTHSNPCPRLILVEIKNKFHKRSSNFKLNSTSLPKRDHFNVRFFNSTHTGNTNTYFLEI